MTFTQSAARAVAAQLPDTIPRSPDLDSLIEQIIAQLTAWLKGKCYKSPEAAYAYLTRDYYWDVWGWRAGRRNAAIHEAVSECVRLQRGWYDASLITAVRGALDAHLTLPLLRGLYEEAS